MKLQSTTDQGVDPDVIRLRSFRDELQIMVQDGMTQEMALASLQRFADHLVWMRHRILLRVTGSISVTPRLQRRKKA